MKTNKGVLSAFTISALDFNNQGEEIEVLAKELIESEVGKKWEVVSGNSHRECTIKESATVIYKKEKTVLYYLKEIVLGLILLSTSIQKRS
jgi:hypothetical protein